MSCFSQHFFNSVENFIKTGKSKKKFIIHPKALNHYPSSLYSQKPLNITPKLKSQEGSEIENIDFIFFSSAEEKPMIKINIMQILIFIFMSGTCRNFIISCSLPTCFISATDIYSPSYAFYCLLVESIWRDRDSAHIAPASSNSYAYACCA